MRWRRRRLRKQRIAKIDRCLPLMTRWLELYHDEIMCAVVEMWRDKLLYDWSPHVPIGEGLSVAELLIGWQEQLEAGDGKP